MTDGGRFGGANVTVALPGGCQCPGSPHETDEVYLLPKLSFDGGYAADEALRKGLGTGDPDAVSKPLVRAYLEHQVAGWNLVGEDGMGLPFSPALLLSDWDIALAVGNVADDLYSEALLRPLVEAVSTSSPGGRTARSTSRKKPAASKARKR